MPRAYIRSGRRVDAADRAKIWRLHREGLDSRIIAERLAVSRDTVSHILTAHRAAAAQAAAGQLAAGD